MAFRIVKLLSDPEWALFEALLSEKQSCPEIVRTLTNQLKSLNVRSALVEEDYIDRDFSEAYSAYYAKTFRRHTKLCTRVLFFATDISSLNVRDVLEAAEQLEKQLFVGYIVLRPISRAPLCQAVLALPPTPPNFEGYLHVRGTYRAHVFGADLSVEAAPMTQQDSRIGACAQAAIWVAVRHFHTRHRGPWLSTVSITEAATSRAEASINLHVPAGSEFLTINNMIAALRSAGREPLIYAKGGGWGALRPADVINRYVDSGIPVIIGLEIVPGQIGHAIVATGHIIRDTPRNNPLPSDPTLAEYCEAFYANDDQIGPNIRVPVSTGSAIAETYYSIDSNAIYLIVPLPEKVYLPAETAEALAWDCIKKYSNDWSNFKSRHANKLGTSVQLGDSFVAELAANAVIARTYLTHGWKYKHRGIRNKFTNPIRQVIRSLETSRFVYVTEFTTIKATSTKQKYDRRIFAHCVVDATAKHEELDSVLLIHAPGFCKWRAHDRYGSYQEKVAPIKSSTEYYPKIRGEQHFGRYEAAP